MQGHDAIIPWANQAPDICVDIVIFLSFSLNISPVLTKALIN